MYVVFEIFHKLTATPGLLPLLQSYTKAYVQNVRETLPAVQKRWEYETSGRPWNMPTSANPKDFQVSGWSGPDDGDGIVSKTLVCINHLTQLSAQGDCEGTVRVAYFPQKKKHANGETAMRKCIHGKFWLGELKAHAAWYLNEWLTFKSLAVSFRTTRFNIQKFYMALSLRWVFYTDLRTDSNFCLYIINWPVFITVVESVYCAVRTDSLYKADYVSPLKG